MNKQTAGKIAIGLFCVWHMAAVAAYSLPNYAPAPVWKAREAIVYVTRPYILLTSQWQKWNLFSPDPLRRVIAFHIERKNKDDTWEEIDVIGPDTAWWHKATELKTIRRMEESEGGSNLLALRERYLQSYCKDYSPGTDLRLRIKYYVIPRHVAPATINEWHAYTPQWNINYDALITCPSR